MQIARIHAFGLLVMLFIAGCEPTPTVEEQPADTTVYQSLESYGIPAKMVFPESDVPFNIQHHNQVGSGQHVIQLAPDLAFLMRKENTELDQFRADFESDPIFSFEYLPSSAATLFCKSRLPDGTTITHHIISKMELAGSSWIVRTDPNAELSGVQADLLLEAVESIQEL